MRKLLDALYRLSVGLAAASVACIALIVFGQVVLNIIDSVLMEIWGFSHGLLIPSYTLLSGYALSFATFLSLGGGLHRAVHIRVTLVEDRLNPLFRRITFTLVAVICVLLGVLLTYSLGKLTYQSFLWGDRANGLLGMPLWIPQSVICLGAAVFLIAAIDTLADVLRYGDSKSLHSDSPADEGL